MANSSVAVPLSELTTDQAVRHLVRTSIPNLQEEIMALNDAIQRLTTEVATQMQQTADALSQVQQAVNDLQVSQEERDTLQTALDEAAASNQAAADAVNAQADILASDNPEEEPVETPDEV